MFLLSFISVNDTEELGNLHNITISDLTVTRWKVGGLETSSKYKFYMSACTRVGCGKPITEEGITTMEGGKREGGKIYESCQACHISVIVPLYS